MSGKDPREKFIESLDIHDCRVIGYPGQIFLCGGQVGSYSKPFQSWRDCLNTYLIKYGNPSNYQFILSETIARTGIGTPYSDLFELESDIASISAAIVVFIESPGSMAELGAFALMRVVREKLVVIIPDVYYSETNPGFIRQGPIEYLKKRNEDSILAYPIPDYTNNSYQISHDNNLKLILDDINDFIEKLHKYRQFEKKNSGHKMLLMTELSKYFLFITQKEFIYFFELLKIPVNQNEIKKYLHLLTQYDILIKSRNGNIDYYGISSNFKHKKMLKFSFYKNPGRNSDSLRMRVLCADYYRNNGDRRTGLIK